MPGYDEPAWIEYLDQIKQGAPDTLREHLRRAGRSRSPRKLAALEQNRAKALEALKKKRAKKQKSR